MLAHSLRALLVLLLLVTPAAAALTATPAAPTEGEAVTLTGAGPAGLTFRVEAGPFASVPAGSFHVHGPRLGWNVLHATLRSGGSEPVTGASLTVTATGAQVLDTVEVAPGEYRTAFLVETPGAVRLEVSASAPGFSEAQTLAFDVDPGHPLHRRRPAGPGPELLLMVTDRASLVTGSNGRLAVALYTRNDHGAFVPRPDASLTADADLPGYAGPRDVVLSHVGDGIYAAPFPLSRPGTWEITIKGTLPGTVFQPTALAADITAPAYRWDTPPARDGQGQWRGVLTPLQPGRLTVLVHGAGIHEAHTLNVGDRVEAATATLTAPRGDVVAGTAVQVAYRVESPDGRAANATGVPATIHLQRAGGDDGVLQATLEGGWVNATWLPPEAGDWTLALDVPSYNLSGAGLEVLRVAPPGGGQGDDPNHTGRDQPPAGAEERPWWHIPDAGPALLVAAVAALALLRRKR